MRVCCLQRVVLMTLRAANCRSLRAVGIPVPEHALPDLTIGRLRVRNPPRVVLHPSFAVTLAQLSEKFPSPALIDISPTSTLVIVGADITFHKLTLDGALEIRACEGARVVVEDLTVRNTGYAIVALREGEAASDVLTIRGYNSQSDVTQL